MAIYNVRRWIRQFYDDEDDYPVWVIFEDDNNNIHYRYIGYDGDRQLMQSQEFYKTFNQSDLQADE